MHHTMFHLHNKQINLYMTDIHEILGLIALSTVIIASDFFTCASRVPYSHFCFRTHKVIVENSVMDEMIF